MVPHATFAQWILGLTLILSAIGVVSFRKPIYASLSFLLSLILLAVFYLQLSAEFIAIMQVLVYAGAILVIFVFVIVLFQDAHAQMINFKPQSHKSLIATAATFFFLAIAFFWYRLIPMVPFKETLPEGYGSAHAIGRALYLDFFFPFEAVILIFLVAIIGALYLAKKER